MTRDEIFDEIYQSLENELEIELSNPYEAIILPYFPSYEFDELPVIILSQIDYRLTNETLNKKEKQHEIVLEAQIFAIDKSNVNKRVIANQLGDLVETIIQDNYGLRLENSSVIPNVDENIYRIVLRFRGYVYDDNKTIYRYG